MATATTTRELERLVQQLKADRQAHVDAVAKIDATFEQFGITPKPRKRRGRPPGSGKGAAKKAAKKTGRRKRGRFSQSGDDSVLAFVKGKGSVTSKEINEHWTKEGRAGRADNAITKLIKAKKLKRQNIKGARGSRYTAK